MAEETFNQIVISASTEKEKWFDTVELPKMQDNYRLHLTCVKNLAEALIKRGLINSDPYKNEKKIAN